MSRLSVRKWMEPSPNTKFAPPVCQLAEDPRTRKVQTLRIIPGHCPGAFFPGLLIIDRLSRTIPKTEDDIPIPQCCPQRGSHSCCFPSPTISVLLNPSVTSANRRIH